MRVYHKYLHEYATVIAQTRTHYAVRYDGDDQIFSAPIHLFELARRGKKT